MWGIPSCFGDVLRSALCYVRLRAMLRAEAPTLNRYHSTWMYFVVQSRDNRINELTKTSLSYNAQVKSIRDSYESKLLELQRDNASRLITLKKELLTVRGQGRLRGKGGASMPAIVVGNGGHGINGESRLGLLEGSERDDSSDGETSTPQEDGSSSRVTSDDVTSVEEMQSVAGSSLVPPKVRHIVKPIRGQQGRHHHMATLAVPQSIGAGAGAGLRDSRHRGVDEEVEFDVILPPSPSSVMPAAAAARLDALFNA